ncbi:MAG: hypothetical protein GWN93_06710 [Deltaproteobacteria bacterium]|nr:hypothetical protein [Deltaproteobacteria bacterium]
MAKVDSRPLVHSPADLAGEYLAWAEHIQTSSGVPFGVKAVDDKVIPMRPGQLVSIIARPGHGKTSLLAYLAREEAKRIQQRNGAEKQAVVYVTWEQSAEELEAFFHTDGQYSISDIAWGRVDLGVIREQVVSRAGLPIWVIGHGIGRAGQKMPQMTPEIVLDAIATMNADYGVQPSLMLFDYMQLVPVTNFRDRVQRVTEVPILIKQLALQIGVPAVVGVQASRSVDDRAIKIPEINEAQWASSIEQTSDKVFGLWRPCQTEELGQQIDLFDGSTHEVTERLFILRLLKQRGDMGRWTWALHFQMEYLRLCELEMRYDEPIQF